MSGNFIQRMSSSYPFNDTSYKIYKDYGFKNSKYIFKVMAHDKNYQYHIAE